MRRARHSGMEIQPGPSEEYIPKSCNNPAHDKNNGLQLEFSANTTGNRFEMQGKRQELRVGKDLFPTCTAIARKELFALTLLLYATILPVTAAGRHRKAPRARRALTLRGFLGFCEAERSMRARLPSLEAQIHLHCRPSATAHPLARRLSRSACFRPEDYHMS